VDEPLSLIGAVRSVLRTLAGEPGPVVVAVSGGPDSVALFHAVLAWRAEETPAATLRPVIVAHLNHQLRGAESDADEEFVRALYSKLQTEAVPALALRTGRLDVAAEARAAGANLEAAARHLRYRWLLEVAREVSAPFVFTGHTADDQAETLLHRLLRGTGLRGLRGIAFRRPLGAGVDLVRPLLHVTRSEVLSFLAQEGIRFCQDSSNRDLLRTRNRIRHELLPHLAERYNPAIVRVLGRLACQAAEAFAGQEALVHQALREAERPPAGDLLVLDRRRLAELSRPLLREVFRLLWQRQEWPVDRMGFHGWERLAGLTHGEASALDLPGGIHARLAEPVIQLGRVRPG
jgi:tRNA(Ile)-lysidine synthase